MDETEIRVHYKLALDKAYEPQLLSELTLKPVEEIMRILADGGFDVPKNLRKTRLTDVAAESHRKKMEEQLRREMELKKVSPIRRARLIRGWTIKKLAEKVGVSASTITFWSTGRMSQNGTS